MDDASPRRDAASPLYPILYDEMQPFLDASRVARLECSQWRAKVGDGPRKA